MERMTGEITVGEVSLLLRPRVGVFVLDRGKGILAGEAARVPSALRSGYDGSGDGGVPGLCSAAMTAFGGIVKDGN